MPSVCKLLGASEQTYYRWRKEYGGLKTDQAKKLKEITVYHAPRLDGRGGSSMHGEVIARYRHDDGSASTSPANEWADAGAILKSREVSFQNWRGDVVAFYERGHMERIHYTPYGEPYGRVYADQDRDGDVDVAAWTANYNAGSALADANFDAVVDNSGDFTTFSSLGAETFMTTGGDGTLSAFLDNRLGYAGYRLSFGAGYAWHVRFRDYLPGMGRWTRRDPIGYHDGMNLYAYVGLMPVRAVDPMGLAGVPYGGRGGCGSTGGCGSGRGSSGRDRTKDLFNIFNPDNKGSNVIDTIIIDDDCPPNVANAFKDPAIAKLAQELQSCLKSKGKQGTKAIIKCRDCGPKDTNHVPADTEN